MWNERITVYIYNDRLQTTYSSQVGRYIRYIRKEATLDYEPYWFVNMWYVGSGVHMQTADKS